MYWTRNSMNNLLSYFGYVDARISASEKDLPVPSKVKSERKNMFCDKKNSEELVDQLAFIL